MYTAQRLLAFPGRDTVQILHLCNGHLEKIPLVESSRKNPMQFSPVVKQGKVYERVGGTVLEMESNIVDVSWSSYQIFHEDGVYTMLALDQSGLVTVKKCFRDLSVSSLTIWNRLHRFGHTRE
jgi:hypothetical protein